MGRKRDSMIRKLKAFEEEMNEYAKTRNKGDGKGVKKFVIEKQLQRDILTLMKEPGATIETIIDDMRPKIKHMIDNPSFYVETRKPTVLQ